MSADDKTTTIDELKQLFKSFCDARGWDPYHTPKDLAIGLVTEASELLELFRFVSDKELPARMNNPTERAKMADELADSLVFILRFAQLHGFDLSAAVRQKLVKNARKYPAP